MFDIGFSELLLVFVIGLIVLGPQRLPVAVKTVVGWIRAMRSLAANVQNELAQELKLQELQDSLKKVEEAGKGTLSPELKESMEELRKTADSMKRTYREATDLEHADDVANAKATAAASPAVTPQETVSETVPFATERQKGQSVSSPAAESSSPAQQPDPSVVHAPATPVAATPGQATTSSGSIPPASESGKSPASPVSEER
ncbi:Sec-independent protein translocase protein TatB [Tatumella sp. JGM118]|uniref:Sec-independent protein translocase protein TatB n=1 Tax=Tatumella terrea TaxID=419007 RepID=A0ABW1VSL1_9GAMM|nr:Sec-independent protein translocase subunit TatB [Tatumella sp. JGM118]